MIRLKRLIVVTIGASTLALTILAGLGNLAAQAPQGGAAQATYPKPTGATPSACRAEIRAFVEAENKAAGITGGPITDRSVIVQSQRINAARLAMTKDCAARFDVATASEADLDALANLYLDAKMIDLAKAASDRTLGLKNLTPADRAAAIVTAVGVARSVTAPNADRAWRVANNYPRIEALIDELEKNPAASFSQKWGLRTSMENSYRLDDVDAGILKHGEWIVNAAKKFTPEERQEYGATVVAAHVNMAEAYAGQAMNDKGIALLREAKTAWKDVLPWVESRVDPTLRRYELVGTKAAAITAPTWLNAPAGTTDLAMAGQVTLLEFSAHWCGPCRESYPGINRLRERYKKDGFRVVIVTRLWGYFGSERDLPADKEIARDREYFGEHGLDVPIAIGRRSDGAQPDPNNKAYGVGGIPQIQLIDKKGTIRLIMVGYDRTNEDKLARLIETMVKEK